VSRFTLDHPLKPTITAAYGHDHAVGFFCEIFREGRVRPIKTLDVFTTNEPVDLIDCLDFLATNGFYAHEHLEDALLFMRDEDERHGTEEAMLIVKIIEAFVSDMDGFGWC